MKGGGDGGREGRTGERGRGERGGRGEGRTGRERGMGEGVLQHFSACLHVLLIVNFTC